jgi:hypothetical protein
VIFRRYIGYLETSPLGQIVCIGGLSACWHMRAAGEQSLQILARVTPVRHLQICFCQRDPRNVDAEHSLEMWTLVEESSEAPLRKAVSNGGLQLDAQALHMFIHGSSRVFG